MLDASGWEGRDPLQDFRDINHELAMYDPALAQLEQVVSTDELLAAQEQVKEVYLDDLVKEYIINLVRATRKHPDVYLGASPRGSIALYKTGQARAAIQGRPAMQALFERAIQTGILRDLSEE